jgi:hypothetical protein
LAFTGNRITWQFTKHSNRGTQQIYIDNTHVWTHNTDDNNNTLWQVQKTWEVPNGNHIIEVRGLGNGVDYTDTDAFIINTYGQTGNHEDNNLSTIEYLGSGSWTHSNCCPTASGGTISWSNTTNNSASIHFYGTGIRYIHTKAYNRGKVKVTIDGVYTETLDLYANPNQWQQVRVYNMGLGYHQIHFTVTGTKNPASVDYYVDIDKFEIIP